MDVTCAVTTLRVMYVQPASLNSRLDLVVTRELPVFLDTGTVPDIVLLVELGALHVLPLAVLPALLATIS